MTNIETIVGAVDSLVALALAVWMLIQGLQRFDRMQQEYGQRMAQMQDKNEQFTRTVLQQQQQNNDQLMSLVSTLCVTPVEASPRAAPKAPAA